MIIGLIFGSLVALMAYQGILKEAWHHVFIAFALVFGLFLYLNLATSYSITKDGFLEVICGIFVNTKIPIHTIKTIRKTRIWVGSPAPSMDRLIINFGDNGEVIISPENKQGFIADLQKINPSIQSNL